MSDCKGCGYDFNDYELDEEQYCPDCHDRLMREWEQERKQQESDYRRSVL